VAAYAPTPFSHVLNTLLCIWACVHRVHWLRSAYWWSV